MSPETGIAVDLYAGTWRTRPVGSGRWVLSQREVDVLHWLSLGKSGGETAALLGISVCTVRAHIRNIVKKLEASNIPHAVARAFRMGIFTL